MSGPISERNKVSPMDGRPQERDGTSDESAQAQHRRWLGQDKQPPGAPYKADRVSTPKREDQPARPQVSHTSKTD